MWFAIIGTLVASYALFGFWGVVAWLGLWISFFGLAHEMYH